MKIDYTKIMPYNYFIDNYAPIIDSELYDFITEKIDYLKRDIQNKNIREPQRKVSYINDYFRNEKNSFYKYLVISNCLFDDNIIFRSFEINDTNLTDFIAELSKIITFSKIVGNDSLKGKNKKTNDVLNTIGKWSGCPNYTLIALKIYDLGFRKELEKKDEKKK